MKGRCLLLISRSNSKIKFLESLRTSKGRKQSHCFLVEGSREVERAHHIEMVYFHDKTSLVCKLEKSGVALVHISKRLLEKVSIRGDIVAVCRQDEPSLNSLSGNFFLGLVGIEKPGNLGAILRTCDGAGVKGVLLIDSLVDQFHPNVVRTSLGAVFSLDIVRCSSDDAFAFIRKNKIETYVTTPIAKERYSDIEMGFPLMVVMGQEDKGLPEKWMNGRQVSIPMKGICDSLNVSVSTGIVLYEVLRKHGL